MTFSAALHGERLFRPNDAIVFHQFHRLDAVALHRISENLSAITSHPYLLLT